MSYKWIYALSAAIFIAGMLWLWNEKRECDMKHGIFVRPFLVGKMCIQASDFCAMTAPSPLIAKVSAALRKAAIAEWPDTADIVVIEGYPDDLAQVAVDACCVGELVRALRMVSGRCTPEAQLCVDRALAKLEGKPTEQPA